MQDVCIITKSEPTDPRMPMEVEASLDFAVDGWEQIVSMSAREERRIRRGEKTFIVYLPTLSGMELWMKFAEWEFVPITRQDFFQLVTAFHRAYIDSKLRQ